MISDTFHLTKLLSVHKESTASNGHYGKYLISNAEFQAQKNRPQAVSFIRSVKPINLERLARCSRTSIQFLNGRILFPLHRKMKSVDRL